MISDFFRKIKILYRLIVIYLYYTAKPNNINPIHYMRIYFQGSCLNKLRNDHEELFKLLLKMISLSNSTGCEFGDYLLLYNTIKKIKPKCVLECGSGITSCVIAFALKENYQKSGIKSKFISLEENQYYHEQVKKIFPDSLNEYVQFVLSERVEKEYLGELGCFYENMPNYDYDFVFIDGPTLRSTQSSPKCFNADIINILEKLNPDQRVDVLIDQRVGTYWVLKSLIPGAKIEYDVVKKIAKIHGASNKSLAPEFECSGQP